MDPRGHAQLARGAGRDLTGEETRNEGCVPGSLNPKVKVYDLKSIHFLICPFICIKSLIWAS